ncbi:hypothetical protein [Calothrix sp. CCY 0018]|uniref:hypothetical protein n=1 Tax=Calothrix sp. CCY 0018 TaxID=3103864 RepID=UPI0039C62CE5
MYIFIISISIIRTPSILATMNLNGDYLSYAAAAVGGLGMGLCGFSKQFEVKQCAFEGVSPMSNCC